MKKLIEMLESGDLENIRLAFYLAREIGRTVIIKHDELSFVITSAGIAISISEDPLSDNEMTFLHSVVCDGVYLWSVDYINRWKKSKNS